MTLVRNARVRAVLAAAALAIVLAVPSAANAWWRGGWGIGIGIAPVVPVYPPPVYYYPPPAYYPPPVYTPAPAGQACYAGPYVCPLDRPSPVGAPCSCPTNNGRAGGQVG